MIPSIDILTEKIKEEVYPNKTYKINLDVILTLPVNTAVLGQAIVGYMTLGTHESTSTRRVLL